MPNLTYSIAALPNGLDLSQLSGEISAAAYSPAVTDVGAVGDVLKLELAASPSTAESVAYAALVAAHNPANAAVVPTTGVFGVGMSYSSLGAPVVTTSTNWVNTLTLTTPNLEQAGVFRVSWCYSWAYNHTSSDFVARVTSLGSDLMTHRQEPKDSSGSNPSSPSSGTDQAHPASGFTYFSFPAGVSSVQLQHKAGKKNKQATVLSAALEIWRVA